MQRAVSNGFSAGHRLLHVLKGVSRGDGASIMLFLVGRYEDNVILLCNLAGRLASAAGSLYGRRER